MIKEELRKEIEKEAIRRTKGFKNQENCIQSYIMGALDFIEKATHDTVRPSRERAINEVRKNKFKIKAYQRCINHLDNWFKGELK